MKVLRIQDSWPWRPPARGRGARAIRSGLCVAILLAAGTSLGAAQTRTASGWLKTQFQGSTGGDPAQGESVAKAKCAACHGRDGNSPSPQYPKLAGQNPNYLYQQLWAFATGTRSSQIMSGIAATLSRADAANVASFYAEQTIRPDPVKDRLLANAGERIFFAAGGPGVTPGCAMCHGASGQRGMMGGMSMMGRGMMGRGMMGTMADVPNLNGQHAVYVVDQLNRYARGERQGAIMNRIAAGLSEAQRKAVAEFVSGIP